MALLKDLDDRQMPLLDHLIELRNRLMYSCIAIFLGFLVCYFFAEDIYAFLVQPLADIYQGQTGRRMIYTGLAEAFFTYVKVAFWAGAFLTFPFVATQLWLFIAPGLYREREAGVPAVPGRDAGAVLPRRRDGLLLHLPARLALLPELRDGGGDGSLPIELEARVGEYLSLVMKLIFAFGLSFQLPVALTLMGRVGLISAEALVAQPQIRDRRRLRRRGDHHAARHHQPDRPRHPDPRALRALDRRGAHRRAPARRGRGGRGGGRRAGRTMRAGAISTAAR